MEQQPLKMRLQKAIARSGLASRRASEKLIRQRRVSVNGQIVTEMGVQVDPEHDRIAVDGEPIHTTQTRQYIMLHKPKGYLSVLHDDRGRPALIDLVPGAEGLHPVGRLDLDSEGLILLTDDGKLTYHLTHPRFEHTKTYYVLVRGSPDHKQIQALREGVLLEDGMTAPAQVRQLYTTPWGGAPRNHAWLSLVIHEGRKRQIKRMGQAVGLSVRRLIRVRIGPLDLGDLPAGAHRPLTRAERNELQSTIARSGKRRSRRQRRENT